MPSNDDVRLDIQELHRLVSLTESPRVRNELLSLIARLESSLAIIEPIGPLPPAETVRVADPASGDQKPRTVISAIATEGFVNIHNHGWDQSDNYVKIYLTDDRLKGVEGVEPTQTDCQFDDRLVSLIIRNFKGRHFRFEVNNLAYPIVAAESSCKLKKDMVLLMLRKRDAGRHWDALTGIDRQQKVKDAKKFETKPGENADPNASIMNLMKKMYDEGDDDMKRMINQSWSKSQDKKRGGGDDDMLGGMSGMAGMGGMPEF